MVIAEKSNNNRLLSDIYKTLYHIYKFTNSHYFAYEYIEKYIDLNEKINSEDNNKAIMDVVGKYESDKKDQEIKMQKELLLKEKKIAFLDRKRRNVVIVASVVGFIILMFFLIIVYNRFKITQKQKHIIEEQKLIVEVKQKEILDSIQYAKRIQQAILPANNIWQKYLPQNFVLYIPKDIVAGDFYWMEYTGNYLYVAAADCTGHGVPGALVSVVCSNALTKTVLEEKIIDTDKILDRTREIVVEKLSKSETELKDGMDIALCRIDLKDRSNIQYSGANRPLYIFSGNNFEEYKGDKQPIGSYSEAIPFSKIEIKVLNDSIIYMFTDGYADQFGGEKNKKIGNRAFKDLLQNISGEECSLQKQMLSAYIESWKQDNEQIDDVTVVGIRF